MCNFVYYIMENALFNLVELIIDSTKLVIRDCWHANQIKLAN
jgi:hypothetical protein